MHVALHQQDAPNILATHYFELRDWSNDSKRLARPRQCTLSLVLKAAIEAKKGGNATRWHAPDGAFDLHQLRSAACQFKNAIDMQQITKTPPPSSNISYKDSLLTLLLVSSLQGWVQLQFQKSRGLVAHQHWPKRTRTPLRAGLYAGRIRHQVPRHNQGWTGETYCQELHPPPNWAAKRLAAFHKMPDTCSSSGINTRIMQRQPAQTLAALKNLRGPALDALTGNQGQSSVRRGTMDGFVCHLPSSPATFASYPACYLHRLPLRKLNMQLT